MEKETEQKNENLNGFYKLLSSMKAVSPIYEKIMKHLVKSLAPELSDDAQKVLYIYFSLLEDGNTRIPLDADKLLEKWNKKWSGLVVQAKSQDKYNVLQNIDLEDNNYVNKQIFEKGINDLLIQSLLTKTLFEIDENDGIKYLYANKYYEAKLIIEDKFKRLFNKNIDGVVSGISNDEIIKEIRRITNSEIELNTEQLEAVTKGIKENIIVTGGPGTGKTTVVAFILWFLLKDNNDFLKSNIYLTAPSGKAADRVGESLKNTLLRLTPDQDEKEIMEKLLNLESYTIHRLLKYNPGAGKFTYNKDNQFADESIFVIDEASMIDISMFANLLQAIPDTGRVFILGDVDQLPSVDVGAVLGDLLNSSDNVVRLIESKRFKVGSEIAELKDYIQDRKLGKNTNYEFSFEQYDINKSLWIATASVKTRIDDLDEEKTKKKKHKQVRFISLFDEDYKTFKNKIEDLLKKWINNFYFEDNKSICSIAGKVNPLDDTPDEEQQEVREKLWNMSLRSKILCAEKNSLTGLDKVNSFVYYYLKQYLNSKNLNIATPLSEARNDGINNQRYFCGQQLIITKNQEMYKLYNGDTGVVVGGGNGVEYLMVKKNNEYAFYPLSIFPIDSIENAFAITIHKSQGSEYNYILMLLPNMVGHRVLTNQIVYTGITRAKESVMIVGTEKAFDYACKNVIERDTGICLSN